MTNKPRLLFYIGFLIFLIGFISEFFDLGMFRFLELIGTWISTYAIIKWLGNSKLKDKFHRENGEDVLTYFWNKIVIRLWGSMFFLFMFFSTLAYLLQIILN